MGRRIIAILAVAAAVAACTDTSKPDFPRAAPAARAMVSAWNERSDVGMMEMFDGQARAVWEDEDLGAWFDGAMETGLVEDFTVELTGGVDEPTASEMDDEDVVPSTEVPYAITYRSEAASEPIRLEGELPVVFDRGAEVWQVPWRIEHMWPGVAGARGFAITREYGERGTLVDRNGRVLAKGTGSNRRYPAGSTAGSTIGHIEKLDRREVADASEGRAVGDLVGGSGLEEAFEERLAGRPAMTLFAADLNGEPLKRLGASAGGRGRRVRTTLDLRVQRAAAAAMGDTGGGAVVMDPENGDLLAIVSSSEFNPAFYIGVDELSPFNRAISGLYAPGSSLKVVTAAAALDTGRMKPSSKLSGPGNYRGVRNFESGEFGTIDFATALKFSVNTAFAQIAEKLGARPLSRYMEAFGFNREPAMPLAAARSSFPYPATEADLMWGSIGQAAVVATPLQMATVAATIANRGRRAEPRISMDQAIALERAVSRKTAATMTELMENVVKGGTGQRANLGSVGVAGKTGTAELDAAGELNHAWFICFAPSDDAKVAVAVVAELGGVGGVVAAPVARAILQNVLPLVR
jgi:beta-lactamase class D